MKLRKWQSKCVSLVIKKFKTGKNHVLTLATPGAGKTFMVSVLAEKLYKKNEIDLIICFSPNRIVADDFRGTLSEKFNACFEGKIGSLGQSLTYQNLHFLTSDFWSLFERYRVFVIFDEIHHCRGSNLENANAWGEKIILNIQDKAKYSIALTGTPWRSDALPIVLSQYCDATNEIECDYIYGLKNAIADNVCRVPQIIAIDNDNISVTENKGKRHYTSFLDLLSQSIFPYSNIIENEQVISHVVSSANIKLNELRKINPNAGGLIVASSVAHAAQIQGVLRYSLDERAIIVTYREDEPMELIKKYRNGGDKWIISVGMISEGTNIPRLQVCCHLTNIKTEMHYRQILGRILRVTGSVNQEAIMYMPAEPKLVEFANRVGKDVPTEVSIVKFENMEDKLEDEVLSDFDNEIPLINTNVKCISAIEINDLGNTRELFEEDDKSPLTESYEKMIDIFGRFKQESIELNLFTSETI